MMEINDDKIYNCWTCKDYGFLKTNRDDISFIKCYNCKGEKINGE